MQPGRHRPFGNSEALGDFAVDVALHVAHHYHPALFLGQFAQCAFQQQPLVHGLHSAIDRRLPNPLEPDLRTAPAQVTAADVVQDGQEPRQERIAEPKARHGVKRPGEGLLRQVASLLPVADLPVGVRLRPPGVAPHERFVGAPAAVAAPADPLPLPPIRRASPVPPSARSGRAAVFHFLYW